MLVAGHTVDSCDGQLVVDPAGRVVCYLADDVGTLFVLPVGGRDEAAADAAGGGGDGGGGGTAGGGTAGGGPGGAFPLAADGVTLAAGTPPNDHPFRNDDVFAVDLHAAGIRNVRSAVVLAGTFEPTVLLLYEPRRTWAGRLAAVRATAAVAAVAVDAAARTGAVLWVLDGLPHDAATVAAVPDAAGGGGLVLCPSVALHVRHGGVAAAVSVNVFGDVWAREAPPPLREATRQSEVVLSLDQAKATFLAVRFCWGGGGEAVGERRAVQGAWQSCGRVGGGGRRGGHGDAR